MPTPRETDTEAPQREDPNAVAAEAREAPGPIPDNPDPEPEAPQRREEAEEGAQERPKLDVRQYGVDKRNRVYEAARKARAIEEGREQPDEGEEGADYELASTDDLETQTYQRKKLPDRDPETGKFVAKDEGAEEPQPEAPKRKLKVNGREIELSDEELIAIAQKNLAADQRLANAKSLETRLLTALANVQGKVHNEEAGEHHASTDQTPEDAPDPHQVSADRLREVVEAIQTGDAEEGAERLAALIADLRQPGVSADEVAQQVRSMIDQDGMRNRAVEDFRTSYPEIAADDDLTLLAAREAHRLGVGVLRELKVAEEFVAQAERDPDTTFIYLKNLEKQGYTVPSGRDLVMAGAERVKTRFAPAQPAPSTPEPGAPSRDREAEKRSAPQQPRRASIPAPGPGGPPDPMASRHNAVRDMRRFRGQATR